MTISMPRLEHAACVGTEPSVAVCARCWDRPECLAWALETGPGGFWGGYTMKGLASLRQQFGIPAPERRR